MRFEEQVQAVRRRMVVQQVRTLQLMNPWRIMQPDVVADCVLAAGGDAVVANRLALRWMEDHQLPRTSDFTAEEEAAMVAYIKQAAAGFACDCNTCRGGTHGERLVHR